MRQLLWRKLASALVLAFLVGLARSEAGAAEIRWIDVSGVPGQTNVVVNDPLLGAIQVTATAPAQATFPGPAGSLGGLDWDGFDYINYDASSTGTNAPIVATLTFTFLDGPIDTALTPLYFTSSGLAAASTYTIDNDPVYLGDIEVLEGTGTRTPLGGGLLEIAGAGFNHNPDLYRIGAASISSISVDIDQVLGDGAGFTIGAVPEPSTALLLGGGLLGLAIRARRSVTA